MIFAEYPEQWTRQAFEAALDRAGARPVDDPRRGEAVASARRQLAMFEAAESAAGAAGAQPAPATRRRLADRSWDR